MRKFVMLPRALASISSIIVMGASMPTDRRMHLDLTPIVATADAPPGLRVVETLAPSSEPLALQIDTLAPALERERDQVTALQAQDAEGALPLLGPRAAAPHLEVWTATRSTVGEVRISYVMPAALPKPKKRGPHVDLQAIDGGVSGAFNGFLLAPAGRFDVTLHWILPAGQQAVSSFGEGDQRLKVSIDQLREALFLAGPLRTTPSPLPPQGLGVAVLGAAVQLEPAGDWIQRAYEVELHDFHAPSNTPFRILIRSYDGGQVASGHAVAGTFLYYLPPGDDLDTLYNRQTFAHEMVHGLANELSDEPGQLGTWYTEGIADYFSLVLPYRAGLYTADEYRTVVDQMVAAYYTNPMRNIPNDAIDRMMWTGGVSWRVPYTRGMMYFADLDAKLRAHRATVSALDLVNALIDRTHAGAPSNNATWEALLAERVGAWAVAGWHAMMAGRLIIPPSDAFGPCLERQARPSGLFDLGFAKSTGVHAGLTVSGVDPKGNAARAGLRNGDILETSLDINDPASAYADPITLSVRRHGKTITIRYDPHRGQVEAYEWRPVGLRGRAACTAGG